MPLNVKIDPVEKFTQAAVFGETLTVRKEAAAAFAREGLAEAKQTNARILGRIPSYTTTVDGRQNASLESVNPDGGSITFEFDLAVQVLQWIAQTLIERSPVISGAYRKGHTLFADGVETTIGGNVPPADEYVFLNLVPYARKIEIGKTESGRSFVVQVPNRIYERTAKDSKARFGREVDIQFAYRQATGAYRLRQSVGRRRDRQAGSAVEAPAIIIRPKKS